MATQPRPRLLLLFKILIFSMISFFFYWIFLSNDERREVLDAETSKENLFIGCPPFNFTWDSPAVMQALGNRTNAKYQCKRENGLTLSENGKIRLNTEWPNYENHTCEASCAIPKHPYNYTLGPKCIVGKNCDKFNCDFILVNCWRNGEHIHIDVHIQIVENSRDREKQFENLYKASPSKEQAHRSDLYRPDVVIFVIDSVGRFVAKRELQETYKFMTDELKAVDFTQYTQSAFDSRKNALAIFWGEIGATIDRTEYGGTILKENSGCRIYYDDRPNVQFEYETVNNFSSLNTMKRCCWFGSR
ncbi:unnamed protein product, partial [Mesorhabditis belari]|uniref:Uncharacterized protein n=1 Tax=Mesorhabditis belari TaxID=2138241 RepID=A0AAF3FMJ4_9BILA